MDSTRTPSQLYALVVGGTLVFAGLIGFLYSTSFGAPGEVDEVFGLLGVNAWHNLVHIATGVAGLFALRYGAAGARAYAGGLGLVYVAIAIWGFALGEGNLLGFIPVNTEDNVLHTVIGLAGLGAYAASGSTKTTSHRTAPSRA
ncbi:MAG TPA: DUF4383 domain-containing protein [Solirubrobacteraceae bacterium]|nr:DUF4383 domain-containing protein [Solirubrobacteraceae bacterium]